MENKSYDSQLVSNSKLSFIYNNNINTLALNDDGVVECIYNGKVTESFIFSKKAVADKCKQLFQEGYKLEEIDMSNNNEDAILQDTENVKQNLEKELDDVKKIKELKDEIDANMDDILDESKLEEAETTPTQDDSGVSDVDNNLNYGIVILSKKQDGTYEPDVAVKSVMGDELLIADTFEDIIPLEKSSGSSIVKEIRKEMSGNTQWKIELWALDKIKEQDDFWENAKNEEDSDISDSPDSEENDVAETMPTDNVEDTESKTEAVLKESFQDESTFPSTDYTEKVLCGEEIRNLEQCYKDNLSPEQIIWINTNVDDIEFIIEGFIGLLELVDLPENMPFMSINDYLGELINEEVPNDENV